MAKSRRKMSAKQIKFFGSKRQKAALRAKRSAPTHRARTRPNPPRKKRTVRPSVAKNSARKRRKNPTPMILSWAAGNPAKGGRKVARSKRKTTKRRATANRNAGRRHVKKVMRHRRRSNPGAIGNPVDWLQGGAGVLAGVVGARAIPQLILGASNQGPTGYVANAVAAAGLGFLSHMLFPRNLKLTAAVVAGGFAGLIARIISDQTPFGSTLSMTGLGDWGLGLYQKSNYPNPPRLQNGRLPSPGSSQFTWGDGSQAMSTQSNYGSDSMSAC